MSVFSNSQITFCLLPIPTEGPRGPTKGVIHRGFLASKTQTPATSQNTGNNATRGEERADGMAQGPGKHDFVEGFLFCMGNGPL